MRIKIFITALFLSVLSAYSQWAPVTSGTTNFLTSVQMITATKNYAAGFSGTVLFSTNTGTTWTAKTSPSAANINALYFVPTGNATTGWVGSTGLWKTTNAGDSWVNQLADTVVHTLFFSNVSTGFITTASNPTGCHIRRTTNGGTTFTKIAFTNRNIGSKSMFAASAPIIFILAGTSDSTFIFKSTNSGDNWIQQSKFDDPYHSISFLNANTGIMCGDDGKIQRTTNGGTNWNSITSGTTNSLQKVTYISNNIVYSVGSSGLILKSSNGGLNWFQQSSGTNVTLRGIDGFPTGDFILAAGGNGTIVRTINGGLTAVTQTSTGVPDKFSLEQNYPNPFNPETNISFSVPKFSHVTLKVFDITGREVAQLVNEDLAGGNYSVRFDASILSSGTYFYRIMTGSFSETKKIILIK
jgi:photosystem II stability/assembly factor-like uncharacterized protein